MIQSALDLGVIGVFLQRLLERRLRVAVSLERKLGDPFSLKNRCGIDVRGDEPVVLRDGVGVTLRSGIRFREGERGFVIFGRGFSRFEEGGDR